MNINKEVVMVTRTKFKDIKEELDRNYYRYDDEGRNTYDDKLIALKNSVDKLLTLLDEVMS